MEAVKVDEKGEKFGGVEEDESVDEAKELVVIDEHEFADADADEE